MAKQSITIELDDETIRQLSVLGTPSEVLAQLASSAANGVHRVDHERRGHTDDSLRTERDKTDLTMAKERESFDNLADEVLRIARTRADQVLQTARDEEDEGHLQSTDTAESSARARTQADGLLESERSKAKGALMHRRSDRPHPGDSLRGERSATDSDLTGERAHADGLIIDQREANAQMVSATIRAQELAIEADAAKQRAETGERELRAVAEFRELFIGMLGHDLRTPLGSIVTSAATMLRRGNLGEQEAEMASRIIRSSQRITRMIIQLLDLTRARLGGGLPIEPVPMDLREICRNVVEEFDAAITVKVEGDVTGTWDPDRLSEVLSNLAGNAIEHAARETPVVLEARAEDADVVIEIRNQGDPIPEGVLPFIFEPFRRAKQREKSASGNLGLGLYIAKQIVLSHGGTLEAHSEGGTTTFVIRLPHLATPSMIPTLDTP